MPHEPVRAARDERGVLPRDDRVGEVLTQMLNVQMTSSPHGEKMPTPTQRNQIGNGSFAQAIHCGLMAHVRHPTSTGMAASRSPNRMKAPSCQRSSFSPVACERRRKYIAIGTKQQVMATSNVRKCSSVIDHQLF